MDDDPARPIPRRSWPLPAFVGLICVLAVGSILTYLVTYTVRLRQGPAPAVVRTSTPTPTIEPGPTGQPCRDDLARPCGDATQDAAPVPQ